MSTAVTPTQMTHLTAVTNTTGNAVDATGNTVPNNGVTYVRFTNTNAATFTPSVGFATTVDGQAVTALSWIVPATTGDILVGPFPVGFYGPTLSFTYTGTTTNGKIVAFTY